MPCKQQGKDIGTRMKRQLALWMMGVMALTAVEPVMAAEENSISENSIRYITAFEELPEEIAYIPCEEKAPMEEVMEIMPDELQVLYEGDTEYSSLAVDWVCDEDYTNTEYSQYEFYPQWEESEGIVADNVEVPAILIEINIESDGPIRDLEQAKKELQKISQKKEILALVYLTDSYEVRSSASEDADTVATVVSGQTVEIQDVEVDEDYNIWYHVAFYLGENSYNGYVEESYLAVSDEAFLSWQSKYEAPGIALMGLESWSADVDQFPASYQNALYELKRKHPGWTFVKMNTGLDWNTVIANERKNERNCVYRTSPASWKDTEAKTAGSGWYTATESIIKYYMDPRNFLADPYIFQFEQLTYNASYHTESAVQTILNSSFMSGGIPGEGMTYAHAFASLGSSTKVSPFHLASRVLQEQGTKGTSALISGTYSGYEGYYNYFNVGASGANNHAVILNGLKKAKEYGWNTRYKSLSGGATVLGSNYILRGQDTLYLEKFNVSKNNTYSHQYMQNLQAPYSESQNIRKAYANAGALENTFVFKIPVYNNMPSSACAKPDTTDKITLSKTTVDNLAVGKTEMLEAYVNGSMLDNTSELSYTSSDNNVATIDGTGKITAVSPGTATITCAKGGAAPATCKVTVIKADPSVSVPTVAPVTYAEGLTLTAVTLPSGWKWKNETTAIKTGTVSYEAVYTPSDIVKYNTVTKQISVTVTKAIPTYASLNPVELSIGDTLQKCTLPSGYAWESDGNTLLSKAGKYVFYVSYNPDEANYHTITGIPLTIVVPEPEKPTTSDDSTSTPSTGTSAGSTSTPSTGTSTGSTSTPSTGTSAGSTSTPSTGTSMGSTSSPSTGTSTGSTSSPSTGTSAGSAGTPSTGTSTGSTSSPSTGTSAGSTSTPSTGTSTGSTSSPSTGTSTGSTSTPSTGTSTSKPSTPSTGSTSTPSTGTSTGSTSTPSTGTSTGSTSTPSTGTSTGSTSSPSTGTSVGSTSSPSTGTSAGSTSTPSTGTSTSKPSTPSTPSTNNSAGNNNTPSTTTTSETGGTVNTTPAQENTQTTTGAPATTNAQTTTNAPAATTAPTVEPQPTAQAADQNTAGTSEAASNHNSLLTQSEAVEPWQEAQPVGEDAEEEQSVIQKPVVVVAMNDTTILTPDQIKMAKEQNIDLVLSMDNQISWVIDTDSIDLEQLENIDMAVKVNAGQIPQEAYSQLTEGKACIEISLAHDGPFSFAPQLNITIGTMESGKYANLFYYNPESGQLEFMTASLIDEDGKAAFTFEHASDYMIIVDDAPMAAAAVTQEKTGSVGRWLLIIAILLIILAGAGCGIFLWKRRKTEEEESLEESEEEDEDETEDEQGELETVNYTLENSEDDYDETDYEEDTREEKSKEEELSQEEDDWIEDEEWNQSQQDTLPQKSQAAEPEESEEDDWIEDEEWEARKGKK